MEIRETWPDATAGHGLGDSGWYAPFTDSKAALFRAMQGEYGGCVSKMWRQELVAHGRAAFGIMVPPAYRDVRCGWVFSRRERYDNAEPHWPADKATYIREVWVEVTDPAAEWGWENEQP